MKPEHKTYSIIDPKTNNPYCGLRDIESVNGNLLLLVPMTNQKHWSELGLNESTMTTDGLRVTRTA